MSKLIPMADLALQGTACYRADNIEPGRHGPSAAPAMPGPLPRSAATTSLTYTSFGIHYETGL